MRLAQLARRIGISQTEIVKFLAHKNIIIAQSSNAKIEDNDVKSVVAQFAPELELEIQKAEEIQNDNNVIEEVVANDVTPIEQEEKIVVEELISISNQEPLEVNETLSNDSHEEIIPHLIRAPKIELAGLKVIRKIDLPEAKRKQEGKELAEVRIQPEEKKESRTKRETDAINRRTTHYKNPIEVKREKEEKEKLQKNEEAAAYEKELRTQRYLNKVRRPKDVFREPKEKFVPYKENKLVEKQKSGLSLFEKLMKWFSSRE